MKWIRKAVWSDDHTCTAVCDQDSRRLLWTSTPVLGWEIKSVSSSSWYCTVYATCTLTQHIVRLTLWGLSPFWPFLILPSYNHVKMFIIPMFGILSPLWSDNYVCTFIYFINILEPNIDKNHRVLSANSNTFFLYCSMGKKKKDKYSEINAMPVHPIMSGFTWLIFTWSTSN